MTVLEEIRHLAKQRNAIILAHNYQADEIQDVADFTGDSLELARKATSIEADVIVFCGVYFMAETAAILNPSKTVLIPAADAGCPMADMITAEQLRALKQQHPQAKVLCYVNSTAEVKAESDCCVTSANAINVARQFPPDQEVIFVPDRHLGAFVAEKLNRKFILWPGFCPTHARITLNHLQTAKAAHPGAPVLVHPECTFPVREAADEVLSTGGMCQHVQKQSDNAFIVGTEVGILHRLRQENPEKSFYPLLEEAVCPNMKKVTLENLLWSLRDLKTVVRVPETIAVRARQAITQMLNVS